MDLNQKLGLSVDNVLRDGTPSCDIYRGSKSIYGEVDPKRNNFVTERPSLSRNDTKAAAGLGYQTEQHPYFYFNGHRDKP